MIVFVCFCKIKFKIPSESAKFRREAIEVAQIEWSVVVARAFGSTRAIPGPSTPIVGQADQNRITGGKKRRRHYGDQRIGERRRRRRQYGETHGRHRVSDNSGERC